MLIWTSGKCAQKMWEEIYEHDTLIRKCFFCFFFGFGIEKNKKEAKQEIVTEFIWSGLGDMMFMYRIGTTGMTLSTHVESIRKLSDAYFDCFFINTYLRWWVVRRKKCIKKNKKGTDHKNKPT